MAGHGSRFDRNRRRPVHGRSNGPEEILHARKPQKQDPAEPGPEEEKEFIVPEEVAAAETIVEGMLPRTTEISDDDIFEAETGKSAAPKKPRQTPPSAAGKSQAPPAPSGPKPAVRQLPAGRPAKPGAPKPAASPPARPAPSAAAKPAPPAKPQVRQAPPAQKQKPAAEPHSPPKPQAEPPRPEKASTQEISPDEMARRCAQAMGSTPKQPDRPSASDRKKRATAAPEEDVLEPKEERKSKTESRKKSKLGMPDFAFRGSGAWLALIMFPRFLSCLAGTACVAIGAAFWGRANPDALSRIPQFRIEWLDELFRLIPFDLSVIPAMPWAVCAPAAVFILFAALLHANMRSFRLKSTYIFHSNMVPGRGSFGRFGFMSLQFLLSLLTCGLAWPWLQAASIRRDYASCTFKRRDDAVGFDGSGFQVLWLCILSLIMSPLVLLSLGFLLPMVSIRWIDWEQGHITVKGADGSETRPVFEGSTGSLIGKRIAWALLILLTAGLYGPFAKAEYWNWIAGNTRMERKDSDQAECQS